MGVRFRKSVKLAPGIRASVGKKSASVSFGGRGGRYTISSTGRRTSSVSIPGTGVSYVSSSTRGRGPSAGSPSPVSVSGPSRRASKVYGIIFLILSVLLILMGVSALSFGGWVILVIGALSLLLGIYYLRRSRAMNEAQKRDEAEAE